MARPTKMNKETVAKLEEGFLRGLSDIQACLYAGIDKATLYRYQEKHPDFCDRKTMLKENLKMRAKMNIAEAIEKGDIYESHWYLERSSADEFSTKQRIEIENPYGGLTKEQLERLADADTG